MKRAASITRTDAAPADIVTLTYDDRYRRRMALVGDGGLEFLLDLAEATELRDGDDLVLDDGRTVRVQAAPEELMQVTCTDREHLVRTAWHVGNRHLACEVHNHRLVLRRDHVIADMLRQLGCTVESIVAPFHPEGGAYRHGTHGHDHVEDHG